MPKITTFLTYDDQAEAAAKRYVSVFKNSRIGRVRRFPKGAPRPEGSVMTVEFELDGQEFVALNAGVDFKFTEAVSLSVECRTQKEIDDYSRKLAAGGEQGPCGWLRDKFGLWWQIVPKILIEMLGDRDPEKSKRVMAAMLRMKKLDLAALKKAYAGSAKARR